MPAVPLKRNKALLALSREHHADLLLVWKLRKGMSLGIASERMARYIRYLDGHLIAAHFKDEETLLFDQFPPDNAMCNKARHHHEQLRQLIGSVTDSRNEDRSLFDTLGNLLEEHVRYEERELFPYIEEYLPAAALSGAAEEINKRHHTFIEVWEDNFWEKK